MKKLFLPVLGFIPLLVCAQEPFRYLGLSGNTYVTEVNINISQVRYQAEGSARLMSYPSADQLVFTRSLDYSLFTEPSTTGALIKAKPCVKFQLENGERFTPTAAAPFPPARSHIVRCDCDDADVLKSTEYLFLPIVGTSEGKTPSFAQLVKHEWFISGPFSAMLKYRPKIDSVDNLGVLDEDYSTGVSLSIITGTRHSFTNVQRYGRSYKIPIYYQFPLFMLGANTVKVKLRKDSNSDTKYDSYGSEESRVSLTFGTGVGFQIWKAGVIPLVGWDFLLGTEKRSWPYQGRPWYGLSVGVSLEKLVGLTK